MQTILSNGDSLAIVHPAAALKVIVPNLNQAVDSDAPADALIILAFAPTDVAAATSALDNAKAFAAGDDALLAFIQAQYLQLN
jgi:hypothetical protein